MNAPPPCFDPKIGTYRNVAEAEYRKWPLPSQSQFKAGRASMAHMKAAMEAGDSAPTDAKRLGSALHVAFLEPKLMLEKVVKWEGAARRGAEWTAFAAEHAHQTILTAPQHAQMVGMVRSLRAHPFVKAWQSKSQDVEVSAIGEYCGVLCKGRCDALTPDPLVDVKKVRSGDLRTFTSDILKYGYHMQAALYRRLFDRERFVLVAVEDRAPYDVVPYELSPSMLKLGDDQLQALVFGYRECLRTGEWPGRSSEIVMVEPPEWAMPDVSIIYDEEAE